MASAGIINVVLSASTDMFTSGFKKAESTIQSLAGTAKSAAGAILSPMGALTGIAAGGGMAMMLKSTMENIEQQARLAQRMGVSVEVMNGLQHAAKMVSVDAEELTHGLDHMEKTLGEVASGSGPQAAAVIAHLGLDAKKLADESPDKALLEIADGLSKVHNVSEQAAAAGQLFGERMAGRLVPLLSQGSAGITKFVEEAKKLNPSLNDVNAQKVIAANQAIEKMQDAFTGVVQTVAIQLAPWMEAAADKVVAFGTKGQGAAGYVVDGFGWVLKAIAKSADFLEAGEAAWQMYQYAGAEADVAILKGISYVLDGLDWLLKKVGVTATGWGNATRQMAADIDKIGQDAFLKAGEHWDNFMKGRNSKAADNWIQNFKDGHDKAAQAAAESARATAGAANNADKYAQAWQKAQENAQKVVSTLAELKKANDTFGMSEGQKKMYDLKQLGATADQMQQAQMLQQSLDAKEEEKKRVDELKEKMKSMWQEAMTPQQKYQEALDQIHQAMLRNIITQDQANQLSKKAAAELNKAEPNKKATAEQYFSSFTVRNNGGNDPTVDLSRQQLTEQQKQTKTLGDIYGLFQQGNGPVMLSISSN